MRRAVCLGGIWLSTIALTAGLPGHWRGQVVTGKREHRPSSLSTSVSMPPQVTDVAHLRRILNDKVRSQEERMTALMVLPYRATPRAFESVWSFRDSGRMEFDVPNDLLNTQRKMIDTDVIRHHSPGRVDQIDHENLRGVITLVATLDTAVADTFLLAGARNHEEQPVRQRARNYYARQDSGL